MSLLNLTAIHYINFNSFTHCRDVWISYPPIICAPFHCAISFPQLNITCININAVHHVIISLLRMLSFYVWSTYKHKLVQILTKRHQPDKFCFVAQPACNSQRIDRLQHLQMWCVPTEQCHSVDQTSLHSPRL